ncbi:DNA repair protein [Streptococcus intermedius]|uniref:DNA repair protein n=1 Tax=Streptococcus intermedius TaxID=1338 RepID=UPI000FA47BD4|nr:DNA repair protein [Streptococcus intermedius]MDK8091925.1 DNA repair protein [Streptococcus intermedius]RSJ18030.1 hypothetical protein D8830_05555 [Streptococcus intermedius]
MRTRSVRKKEERNSLKKLSRLEILELFLKQSEELAQVKEELKIAKEELAERRIVISESGSIAEAALKLSGIFEVAQKAANEYLDNVKTQKSTDTHGSTVLQEAAGEYVEGTVLKNQ